MIQSRRGRVLALLGLLCVLLLLVVGYGTLTPNPALGDYPNGGHLSLDPAAYAGQQVQLTGRVTQTDPVVLRNDYEVWTGDSYRTGTFHITVTDLDAPVRVGQQVQVFGIARLDGTVRAQRSVVVDRSNRRYMYGVSALAGLWVLGRLLRAWTLDTATFAIRRRADPFGRSTERTRETGGDANA